MPNLYNTLITKIFTFMIEIMYIFIFIVRKKIMGIGLLGSKYLKELK